MDSDDGEPLFPRINDYHTVNIKLVLATVASLSFMILMLLLLHVYAKYAATSRARSRRTSAFMSRLVLRPHPKPGLDPATIATLSAFVFNEPSGAEAAECAVCLSLLEGGDAVRVLPRCKHLFHVECIDRWFCNHATCPVCRAEVVPEMPPEVWVPVAEDPPPPPVGGGGAEGEGCLNGVR